MLNELLEMKKDLELKGYSQNTIEAYLLYSKLFSQYYQTPPAQLGINEVRNYLHYLITRKKCSSSYVNVTYSALKYLFTNILDKPWDEKKLPRMKRNKTLPVILSPDEVNNIFSVTTNLKHKAILMTIYSAGLRISEANTLLIQDIDSDSMQIRIRNAKGKKDRYTLLSKANLNILRKYWKSYQPKHWLFPGVPDTNPLSARSIQRIFKDNLRKAGINKDATVHTLRHCFATHLLEKKVDIFHIQQLLGHASPQTTAKYIHLTRKNILNIKSPLDIIMECDTND